MIINSSQKTVISPNQIQAKGIKQKTLGLIGQKTPKTLILKTRFGIHTFGLKYPIDVIITDKNLKIIEAKENLKPNRFLFWNPKFNVVIELPKNTLLKSKTQVNDQLEIIL